MNARIRVFPLPSANVLGGRRMSGYRSGKLVFRMGNCLSKRIKHKLTNGIKIWVGNGNTTILFYLNGLKEFASFMMPLKDR